MFFFPYSCLKVCVGGLIGLMERRLRSPHCRIQAQAVAELTTQIEQRLKATSSSLSLSECKQQLDMLWACLLAQVGNQDQGLAALACSALASLHNHYVTAPTLALSDAVARISAAAKTAPACNIPHVFGLISSIFTSAGACNPPPSASTSAAAAAAFQVDGTHRHPFILLLLTRPAESWSCVLHQIRQLILHPAGETAAAVEELEVHHLLSRFLWLEPVFIFVFLHRHSPSSSAAAAIYHFSNLKSGIIAVFRHILVIHHHHHHPLRLPVLSLILKLIRSDLIYSIDKCMGVFNELLSCVNCFLDGNQNGNLEVEISLVLLDAALHINTMIASNFLSSSYVLINGIIETIARIASSSSNSASTEWIIVTSFALSRLLISASAPQQQMLLMSIMDLLLSRESLTPIHPSAVCFMLLPLIQLDHLHNSQQQHPIIKKLTAVLRKVECVLKENVADRVENLSNLLDFSRPPFSSSSSTSPSSSPIITGPLASLISAVKLIHSGSNLCLNSLKFIERDLIVFVVAPILLGPDTKSRQAALSHLSKMDLQTTKSADSSSYSSSSALSLLSLYLYINNRFSQKEPETSRLIFTTSLPNLASPEDPFATSAVLKIILSMTDSGDRLVKRDIKLRPLAALALCNIWKRHGRIWDKLKSRFSDVLLRISRDDGDYLVYGEYKLTLLGIMR